MNGFAIRIAQALGALCLVDGVLQLQPIMFTSYHTCGILEPAAQGQPGLLAFVQQPAIAIAAPNIPLFNALAASVQVIIHAALLARRNVDLVLTVSIVIRVAFQGCGLLLTGASTDVNGAPLLVLFAVGAWPFPTSARAPHGRVLRFDPREAGVYKGG